MNHDMRRADRALPEQETLAVLRDAPFVTVAMKGLDSWPYAVTVSHAVVGSKVYFHSAQTGQKVDCLHADNRVCLTAVLRQKPLPDKLSVDYASAVAFGVVYLVTDPEERYTGLMALCQKYAPDNPAIDRSSRACTAARVYCVEVLELTGKANA